MELPRLRIETLAHNVAFAAGLLAVALAGCQKQSSTGKPRISVARPDGHQKAVDCGIGEFLPAPFPKGKIRAPTGPDSLEYWLLISYEANELDSGFSDDSKLRIGSANLKGPLIVWINGSPVTLIEETGVMFRLNEWLYSGENMIHFNGFEGEQPARDFYIKVLQLRQKDFAPPNWNFERVVVKARITPEMLDSTEFEGVFFVADIEYDPFFDELPTGEQHDEPIAADLRKYLGAVMSCTF